MIHFEGGQGRANRDDGDAGYIGRGRGVTQGMDEKEGEREGRENPDSHSLSLSISLSLSLSVEEGGLRATKRETAGRGD